MASAKAIAHAKNVAHTAHTANVAHAANVAHTKSAASAAHKTVLIAHQASVAHASVLAKHNASVASATKLAARNAHANHLHALASPNSSLNNPTPATVDPNTLANALGLLPSAVTDSSSGDFSAGAADSSQPSTIGSGIVTGPLFTYALIGLGAYMLYRYRKPIMHEFHKVI